jgi:hypothetical protein
MITLHGTDGQEISISSENISWAERRISPSGSTVYLKHGGFVDVLEGISQVKKKYREEMHSLKEIQEKIPFTL